MAALVVLAGLVLSAVLTPRFGADSRDGLDWVSAPPGGRVDRWPGTGSSEGRWGLLGRLRAVGRRFAAAWKEYEYAHEVFWRAQQPWLDEPANLARDSLRWRRGLFGRWRLSGRLLPPAGGRLRR